MNRIKELRLAKGYSLEDLASAMGGVVTKQALSKYEREDSTPSPRVLAHLAGALGVKSVELFTEPAVDVRFIAYRKRAALAKKHQLAVKGTVRRKVEDRLFLQERAFRDVAFEVPVQKLEVDSEEAAEEASEKLRDLWRLGRDPIADLTAVLEDHLVHVIELKADEKFDGISGVAFSHGDSPKAAVVVTRSGCPGDRQRLNLAHELAHVVMKLKGDVDEEGAAFRFAGAFLAPKQCLYREIGQTRTALELEELFILKKRFGMSIQALIRRMYDLDVISETHYRWWFIHLSKLGWRKQEPHPIRTECSEWVKQATLRCLAEGMITAEKAEELLGEKVHMKESVSSVKRRAFLKLSPEERRKILEEQSEQIAKYYDEDSSWRDTEGGDLIEYDQPKPKKGRDLAD